MTKEEKRDKLTALNAYSIPAARRGAFMRWANLWGRFNLNGDLKWYEYSPLEDRSKVTRTMQEMWDAYLMRPPITSR